MKKSRRLLSAMAAVIAMGALGSTASAATGEAMFADVPTMTEIPKEEKKKRSLREKARRFAEDLSSEEISVLTDNEEKFEYEFGVDDDDDDDEYDDEYEDDTEPGTDDDGEDESKA